MKYHINRKGLLYILFIHLFINIYSQNNALYELSKIQLPSTSTQNFMRYGEIPVDYSTGVPKIDIPIYTIAGKNINLPISLSYHASGIKVSDIPSEVGLGWVLNAGGVVSRAIFDTADENGYTKSYTNASQFLSAVPNIIYNSSSSSLAGLDNLETYLNTNHANEDLMSDRFFYQLPNGTSGVFRYKFPLQDSLIMMPYRPYKIEKVLGTSSFGSIITDINITDDNGLIYKFKKGNDTRNITEWYINEIQSTSSNEVIKFNYITQTQHSYPIYGNSYYSKKIFTSTNCDPSQSESLPTVESTMKPQISSDLLLSSIESDEVIVNFNYTDREDFNPLKKLSEIIVREKKDLTKNKIKYTLNHSYFGTLNSGYSDYDMRLKLNNVQYYAQDNLVPQTYFFSYNSLILPPYTSKSIDFWGYYNGATNSSLVPWQYLPPNYQNPNSYYGGNRKGDDYYVKACMLTDIKYPSGGKSKFEYERAFSDGYLLDIPLTVDKTGYVGGLRIAKIVNYTDDNAISGTKSYIYSYPIYKALHIDYFVNRHDYVDYYIDPSTTGSWGLGAGCTVGYYRDFVNSDPFIPFSLTSGLAVVYPNVKEYNGTLTNNTGYTEYTYSTPTDLFPSPENLNNIHPYQEDTGNYIPILLSKSVYNNSGEKKTEELFQYSDLHNKVFNTGINITRNMSLLFMQGPYYTQAWNYTQIGTNFATEYIQSLKAYDTKAYQYSNLLDKKTIRIYGQNQSNFLENKFEYTYNNNSLMAKQEKNTDEQGDIVIKNFKYPNDFSVEPYLTLINKNILTPVIEQQVINNNKQIQKVRTDYKNWGNNIIAPELIKAQGDALNPLENRLRYLSYDTKGNPISIKKEDGSPVTYLYGYNKTLPIALVENSNYVEQSYIDSQNHGMFFFTQPMYNGQDYTIGTFTLTQAKTVSLEREYIKGNDHEGNFFINIYSSTFVAPYLFDLVPKSSTDKNFTSEVLLPAGTYTIKMNVGYGYGEGSQYQHDIYFNVNSNTNINKTIPFHTSFEDDTAEVSTSEFKTGKKSHIGSYKVFLPSSSLGYDKVRISYWAKSSASSPWQYFENIVDTGNGVQYEVGTSMAFVDEVRVYPVDAMMTTYTYDSFYKGQTSVMKQNNQTEYYDYDAFGRLKEVYILEGGVKKTVKTFDHHYKQ